MEINDSTGKVVSAAIKVNSRLGAGFESTYEFEDAVGLLIDFNVVHLRQGTQAPDDLMR